MVIHSLFNCFRIYITIWEPATGCGKFDYNLDWRTLHDDSNQYV